MDERREALNKSYQKDDIARGHTLAWIVIGGILLVCAALFLVTSFKRNEIGSVTFRPGSMEFIACCLCAAVGLFGEIYGIARTALLSRRMKKTKAELTSLKAKKGE